MNYQKYDLVVVNYPFTDLSDSKKRPAVVIKDLEGQNIVICQITTKPHNLAKYKIILKKSQCNGDIKFDSCIYADLITTLHKSQVIHKIGSIKDSSVKKDLDEKLQSLLV